jgi:hypothetical protein
MTLKYVLPVIALAASATVSAEEYQLFTGLEAYHQRYSGDSENLWSVNGTYFFDKKQTLGPLDQLEYINKVTNVNAAFSRFYDDNFWAVGGEYFADNNLVFSARFTENAGFHATSVGIGYLISKDFIVRAQAAKPEEGSTSYLFSASYNHQLQGNDYIGFTAQTDDEFDRYGISSKYFASLGADRFIALGASLKEEFDRSSWAVDADYYFSKMTSVGVSYDKVDNYGLTAKHFFNRSWALEAGFGSNADSSGYKVYRLGVTGQF